jgi:PIN domain nuclease of toxin-antitoxin system
MTSSLLVTDTHPLVWYMTDQTRKLPKKVLKAFDNAVEGRIAILIPQIVLWEISLAVKAGKIRLTISLEEYVRKIFFAQEISILTLETEDVLRSHNLAFTNDPFDRLIVSMVLRMKALLITGDSIIHKHEPCEIFWN